MISCDFYWLQASSNKDKYWCQRCQKYSLVAMDIKVALGQNYMQQANSVNLREAAFSEAVKFKVDSVTINSHPGGV